MKILKEQNLNLLNNFSFLGFVNDNKQFVVAMNHAKLNQIEDLPSKILFNREFKSSIDFISYIIYLLKKELIETAAELENNTDPEFKKGFNVRCTRIIHDPKNKEDKYILYYDLVLYISVPYLFNEKPESVSSENELYDWLDKILDNTHGLYALEKSPWASFYPYYFVSAFTGGFKPYRQKTKRMITEPEKVFRVYWNAPNDPSKMGDKVPATLITVEKPEMENIDEKDFEELINYQSRNN